MSHKRKIIREFSMCEPQKKALEECLRHNLEALKSDDPAIQRPAMEALKQSLRENLPKEENALGNLGQTLTADSEFAWLIHNLPENTAMDFANLSPRSPGYKQNLYSYHIGNALYEMNGVESKVATFAFRENPHRLTAEKKSKPYIGTHIHRDFAGTDPLKPGKATDFAAFSTPINDEHAPTNLYFLEDALNDIPQPVRERTQALVAFRQLQSWDVDAPPTLMTLQEILENLEKPALRDEKTITVLDPRNTDTLPPDQQLGFHNRDEDIQLLYDKIKEHSESIVLKPGDLLVFCEDRIFHQGHPGDPQAIINIPHDQAYSRSLMHHAGTPLAF